MSQSRAPVGSSTVLHASNAVWVTARLASDGFIEALQDASATAEFLSDAAQAAAMHTVKKTRIVRLHIICGQQKVFRLQLQAKALFAEAGIRIDKLLEAASTMCCSCWTATAASARAS